MNNPLVSVNILSFNRKDELRNTLQKVLEQNYKNIEIIVVDNASTDGTAKMVQSDFPEVKLISLPKNIGIAGWNRGFEIVKGEFVLVLDDDAYPVENVIKLIVDIFNKNSNCGAIALKVMNVYENNIIQPFPGGWIPNGLTNNINWSLILGCAFAIRKVIFTDDLFVNKYFLNFHELPIVLQIFRKGYEIQFSKNIVAYHINQKIGKINKIRECMHFRNMINFIFYHFSKPQNILMLIRIIIFYFSRSIKKGWFNCYIDAIKSLSNPMVTFTKERLSKKETYNVIATGVIEYKFSSKFRIRYGKN